MRNLLEKDIQESIIQFLRIKKYVIFKHHSTGFTANKDGGFRPFRLGDKGIADLIGCTPTGRFLAIEVKRKGGKISDEQVAFLDSVRRVGGIGLVAQSLDDVMAAHESNWDVSQDALHRPTPVQNEKQTPRHSGASK